MLAQPWSTQPPWMRRMAPCFNRTKVKNVAPTLIAWGACAGIAALMLLEPTPLARKDVFSNIPLLGRFWQKKLEAAEQKD
ncbi:hypothetical protein SeMB42_g04873 [Synchytrium endobioticum]|uniref:Uncharacterized protein n=1 Tax=Synchytrium endobioticum TaxID=286115 RepID=A0A507CV96_9FUNG|nr:hypothetical protein SeLEV6574_g07311 [Synchytrium endobioticum]TPX43099.1 hypothetical protein SeMB42_g04873 [Synchytrium endobioticum]